MSHVDCQQSPPFTRSWVACVPLAAAAAVAVLGACSGGVEASGRQAAEWPAYGGDPGGSRYSPLDQIDKTNVERLRVAWTYRTGDGAHVDEALRDAPCTRCHVSDSKFEATPVLAGGTLYLSTPADRVIALDPETGAERWRYDPQIDISIKYSEGLVSRGVAQWLDPSRLAGEPCRRTVFLATLDARLVALDGQTGSPCPGFGVRGAVDLTTGVGEVETGEYEMTSPPAVVNSVVVVGSALGDNRRVEVERGVVRGFDGRTGELRWSWDPIPRNPDARGWETWTPEGAARTGAANAWSVLSADPARDMVFVPTGSAAPDHYGGERLGSNLFANSVVALRASTGELLWHFQVVHHDLWDYDVPAQPTLTTIHRDGDEMPAVVVSTKMGHVFVLDRETGAPLFPVEERPVPPSTAPGEDAWPTQPFPVLPPPLHPQGIEPNDAWGLTQADRQACRAQLATLRNEGIFTPPSLEGTLLYPGLLGGTNWGAAAAHEGKQILVTTIKRFPMWVRLLPRERYDAATRTEGVEFTGQRGTPYGMSRAPLLSPSGLPCTPPPWGTLIAVSLESGSILWEVPLGVIPQLADHPEAAAWGSVSLGGPIVTAGGLVFIGAAMDDHIRAFDIDTGREVWKAPLPAGGQATPMTYLVNGKQYVVIAAGGHGALGTTPGDYVVAFALP